MSPTTFDPHARAAEKTASRERDLADLAIGAISPAALGARNGFFAALDPARARVIGRRRRIALKR